MYLKSIEVQGFKSFANKIVFDFHNGITGIVGPNGSGKSNVADAVRWVLGEQRVKQLRGGSMQDVIFAGTQVRKPQGFASVAITLDNSDHQLAIDYDEVTVARRLYRSGESEYKINGSICRLKDVQELFYDTGIGKEGYSIIGQGQIDKILSGKPEERRELFDEAAGIVKFKKRKNLAQKKLEEEKQNLVRVNDILQELEKQVGPLAKQSETARKYLELKEELKELDIALFLVESEEITGQLSEVTKKESIVSEDMDLSTKESDTLKKEYESLELELSDLDGMLEIVRTQISETQVQVSSFEGQVNVLKEQINTEKMNADHIQGRIKSIDVERKVKKEQLSQYQEEQKGVAETAQKSMEAQISAEQDLKQKEEHILALDKEIEMTKSQMIQGMNVGASINAKEQRYEVMLEQIQVRRSEVMQKLLKIRSDESVQEEQIKIETQNLKQLEEERIQIELELKSKESEVENYVVELRRYNKNLYEKQQIFQTSSTKLESLKNLAERYDGYGNSIKRVMEVRDRIGGVKGVVADIITTQKEYETAIETALGGSIQNVVTETEQTAKQLIEYLKKNKFGRVTFLPLNSIGQKSGFQQKEVLKEEGVIGLASSLVNVEGEYQKLAEYLLGRVVVVDTIDHAIILAKKYRYSLRIVTLDGELLSAGGSMTGGAFKNSSNLLGRKREIEELEDICKKSMESVTQIQKEIQLIEKQLKDNQQNLEIKKQQMHKKSLEENTVQININQLQAKRLEIKESAKDLVSENGQLEEQLKEVKGGQHVLEQEKDLLSKKNDEVNQNLEGMTIQLEQEKLKREELAKKLDGTRLEAATLKQKVDFVLENMQRVTIEEQRLKQEKEQLLSHTNDSEFVIASKEKEILEIQKQTEIMIEVKEERLKESQALGDKKTAIVLKQKQFFTKREELSQRITLLDKDLFRLQNQKEKLGEKLEHITNYMWNEYEITLHSVKNKVVETVLEIGALRKGIESLKNEIRKLGHVNVNAIEDYKEVSQRYEFLTTQYQDLIEAEATLIQIIDELDKGMRLQFEEKFHAIKLEFDKVFREMFGGGHGQLELMDGEDILEAGIQIISQPPGKKLQNMMQLSGGEKALTAIALLFAIQNLKPSPFCLLDEIEAALDDSNVDRFAGYLHKLTKHTQFIVITHRRGTMVASDRLYGITMQEKGVSTLVSVNLIEDQLTG